MVFSKVIHISGVPQQGCCAQAYQHCNPLNLKGNVELSTENVFPLLLLLSINKEIKKITTFSQKPVAPVFQQHEKLKNRATGTVTLNKQAWLLPPMHSKENAGKAPSMAVAGAF